MDCPAYVNDAHTGCIHGGDNGVCAYYHTHVCIKTEIEKEEKNDATSHITKVPRSSLPELWTTGTWV